jgi:hypothetical protein
MNCPRCGEAHGDAAVVFCSACGSPLKNATAPPMAAGQPKPKQRLGRALTGLAAAALLVAFLAIGALVSCRGSEKSAPLNSTSSSGQVSSPGTPSSEPKRESGPVPGPQSVSALPSGPQAGSPSLSKMPVAELEGLRAQFVAQGEALERKDPRFTLVGQITWRGEDRVALFGQTTSDQINHPGSHFQKACLVVLNPENNGRFYGDQYTTDWKYYVGLTTMKNGVGASVQCSVYGDRPKEHSEAIAALNDRLKPINEELERRISQQSRDSSGEPALSASTPRPAASSAPPVPPASAQPELKRPLTSTGSQNANEAELLSIQRDIERERQNIASMRKTMENDERIFEANLRDMNKSGSNPAGEIKNHNERKAQREKYIRDSEGEIALREARKAALTGGN